MKEELDDLIEKCPVFIGGSIEMENALLVAAVNLWRMWNRESLLAFAYLVLRGYKLQNMTTKSLIPGRKCNFVERNELNLVAAIRLILSGHPLRTRLVVLLGASLAIAKLMRINIIPDLRNYIKRHS